MSFTIEKISGGTYHGSGAQPLGGNSGTIDSAGANRLCVIVCFTARVLNGAADYHAVDSITATGLTFTHIFDHDFTYNSPDDNPSFPNVYYHCDIFTAPLPTAQVAKDWTGNMRAAGDTFVNEGWCSLYVVDGPTDLDSNGSNLAVAAGLTNSATTVTAGPLSTNAANTLLFIAMLGHNVPTATLALPSGFASTASGAGGDGQFNASQTSGSQANIAMIYKEVSSQQSSATYPSASTANDWFSVAFAFSVGSAPATSKSFGSVIS